MRFVAGRGAVATEILAEAPWWLSCCWSGDDTELDLAGRGTVVHLLARAPWVCCWPRRLGGDAGRVHRGGFVGQGAKEVLLAEGTVAKRMAAPWQEWQHREETAGDGAVHKKTCRGIGVRNLGRCAMIILLLKTH